MGKLTVSQVEPGMIVEEDVRAPAGQLLLGAGAELSEKTIRVLKTWGVNTIKVEGEGDGAGNTAVNLSEEDLAAAKRMIQHRFVKTDISEEPMRSIFEYAISHFALKKSQEKLND
ncbi:hypothetical protein [Aurantivibrio plasticivorans]